MVILDSISHLSPCPGLLQNLFFPSILPLLLSTYLIIPTFHNQGQGVAFIGWCDAFFFGDSIAKCGLGDDSHSWGWGVTSGRNSPPTLKHDGKSSVWFGPAKS
eukprot:41282-Amorphochlora_amoeboformis.AAC.1